MILLRTGILITFGILIICITNGCSEDAPTEYSEIELLATIPEDGGIISATGELKLFFDNAPKSVTVNGKPARIQGNAATIQIEKLLLIRGTEKIVSIEWRNPDDSIAGTKTTRLTVVKRATRVVVDPAPGWDYIPTNTLFRLTFDQEVAAAWLNDTPAVGSGLNWKVSPLLSAGPGQTLNIKWVNQDGSTGAMKVGPYRIADIHNGEPLVVGGTVADGAVDVDPAPINAGGFRFDFDEDVTGTIKLTDEAGADLNWIGTVAGQTATVTA